MKKVHIVSHSHWDREWYLPYERHHMLLIELIDDVLELFENDPEFKSFYLDGQTIILDDYLEVKPDNKAKLQKYIDNGQLKIGPFYILQDAFLTSSESNVRNMLIGHQESLKWGAKSDIGYYPDTFGNPGQTPQLMKQLGFDFAAYGRGVKPTGFANKSNEEDNFVSSYSEMNWKGPDGTVITGLLFANWYSNGNEIPTDEESARTYWVQKLKEAEAYASTDHLLFMNGCDHQPVQKDLTQAICIANELFDDYEFIHSDFDTYMQALKNTLPEKLDTVAGELTSQETEGWYTLTNTASSRVYLKQANARVSRLLENIAEPLAVMASEYTGEYPYDTLDYAWKTLMQNHPHDSICGCSIDTVHDEMETRFKKAEEVGQYVVDESLTAIVERINTERYDSFPDSFPIVVFNTSGNPKSSLVQTSVDTDRIYFHEQYPVPSYKELSGKRLNSYKLVDSKGQEIRASFLNQSPEFGFDLPKNKFRQPFMKNGVRVEFIAENLKPFSWNTYYLVPVEEKRLEDPSVKRKPVVESNEQFIQNSKLKVDVESDGTVTVINKTNGTTFKNALIYEDSGDIGNEYVYKRTKNEEIITSRDKLTHSEVIKGSIGKETLILTHEMQIPKSAEDFLFEEQSKVVEFRNRQSQRLKESMPLKIRTELTLTEESNFVMIQSSLTNEMKDHRVRVKFKTGLMSKSHFADTIFETVERPNSVSSAWTNPENPQRLHHFVNVCNEEEGVILSPDGLNEYEVIDEDNQLTLALTLYRSVGEMGDWGYFPTPGAQMTGRSFTFHYALGLHDKHNRRTMLKEAKYLHVPLIARQTDMHKGDLSLSNQFINVSGDSTAVTALKRNKETGAPVTRLYNMTDETAEFNLKLAGYSAYRSSILEESGHIEQDWKAKPFEIITHLWKKGEVIDEKSGMDRY